VVLRAGAAHESTGPRGLLRMNMGLSPYSRYCSVTAALASTAVQVALVAWADGGGATQSWNSREQRVEFVVRGGRTVVVHVSYRSPSQSAR